MAYQTIGQTTQPMLNFGFSFKTLVVNMLNFPHRFVSECVSLVLNMRQRFCYFANGSASVAVVLLFILSLTYVVWMVFNSDLNYDSPHQRSHLILDHLHDLIQR